MRGFFVEGFANAIIGGLYVVPQMLAIANKDGWSKNEKKHANLISLKTRSLRAEIQTYTTEPFLKISFDLVRLG